VIDKELNERLLAAAEGDDIELVKLVLGKGADVNVKDRHGSTPLHAACAAGHFGIAKLLLDHGANPEARNVNDRTPLHIAAVSSYSHHPGREAIVDWYREHCPELADKVLGDTNEGTVIAVAGNDNELMSIRKLLHMGVDVNGFDSKGETMLYAACKGGHGEVVVLLFEAGADVNAATSFMSATPLHAACVAGHPDIVELLLEASADIDARDINNQTPLHLAAMRGNVEIIRLLFEAGASLVKDNQGHTPADCIIQHQRDSPDYEEIMTLFHEQMAPVRDIRDMIESEDVADRVAKIRRSLVTTDVTAKDGKGRTLVLLTCEAKYLLDEERLDLLRILLELGADPNTGDVFGTTPLHDASLKDATTVARLLIDAWADMNVRDQFGNTPLHLACGCGSRGMVELLLARGADATAVNNFGANPLKFMTDGPKDPEENPAREEIIDLFREYASEMVMEAYCTTEMKL